MPSLNRVEWMGHLGRDPETRYMQNGDAVCNFSVAATEKWKGNDGEMHERTEWLRCVAFKRLGEVCGEYLKKGMLVYIDGSLQTRKWEDKDGVEKYTTECRVSTMKMLSGKPESSGSQSSGRTSRPRKPQSEPQPRSRGETGFDDMDDDLPPF